MADNILNEIAGYTRKRVAEKREYMQKTYLMDKALALNTDTGFPFERALAGDGLSYICECKKASPSAGVIADEYPYTEIAAEYQKAGASAVSVLTEPKYFLGRDEHLREIAETVSIPCLRKDFVVDDYMIYEAKLLGADAVLLICAILEPHMLAAYIDTCSSLGLSALVETRSREEIELALEAGARVIGINNRDLTDFSVDISKSGELASLVPEDVLLVAESGISSAADTTVVREAGFDAVLIGTAVMKAADRKAFLEELNGGEL